MVEALIEQAAFITPTTLFLLLNVVIATILLSSAFNHHRGEGSADTSATPRLARTPSLLSRVTSFNFSNYHPQEDQVHNHHHSHSSPSFFSRVASFNFSGRDSEAGAYEGSTPIGDGKIELKPRTSVPAVARAPSLLSRVASFGFRGMTAHAEVGEIDAHSNTKNNTFEFESSPAPTAAVRRNATHGTSLLSRVASFGLSRGAAPQQVQVSEVEPHLDCSSGGSSNGKRKKKRGAARRETETFGMNDGEVDAKADDFINRFKHQLKLQRIESLMRSRTA